MKIGVKITLISVSAVIALLICFYVGHTRVNELSDMFTYCGDVPITNSDTASSVLLDLNAIARNSAISILYSKNDPEKAVNYIKNCNYLAATMTRKMDYLKERASKGEGQKLIGELITAVKIADEARANMQRLMTNGNWDEATKIRTGKYAILLEDALTAGQAYCDFTTKQSLTYCYVDSNNHAADADFWLTITTIIAAIVLACISIAVIVGTTKPLKQAVEAAEKIAMGDFNVNLETHSKDETGLLLCSMTKMVTSVNAMSYDIGAAIHNTLEGNLKFRADATKHKGNYKDMINALNGLIEAFIEPIEICATAFDHIAIGSDKLAEVTIECKGDFNNIKNSINTAVKTLYTVLGEFNKAGVAAGQGDLSKRADVSKVSGAWTNMLESLNTIMASAESVINDASRALEIMATGDLTPRITNNYVGKFNDIKNYINNLGDSLTDLISQLQTAIHTTASASAEISSTADSLAAATQQQSTQTGEVASAMEEMARTVTDNAQSASRTADVARKSGDIATVGGKVVEQTVNKMREIADVVQLSATNIVKLGESSQKIGEIISVIDDIADQTNLLSLNAAIEAARAGEQGRGFAVVADSVGKLAVSTASATKEIADMIKGIQIDTDAAVVAMEKGTSEVKSGIELADNAGNSIQNILFGINELLDMINQIAAASEQQSATSEQISNNVTLMSKVTAGSAKSIEDVAATANELANMTETLTALVAQFKTDTGATHALPLRSATALASL